MTPITTTCVGCGRTHTIPDRYLGRELKCPGCGHPLRLDAPVPVPAAAEDEPGTVFPEAVPAPEPPAAPAEIVAVNAGGEVATAAVYWRVRRLGILSTATVSTILHGLLGVLAGIVVAVTAVVGPRLPLPRPLGPLLGVVALVAVPAIYTAIGFVVGVVFAALYNLAARLTGGVKILLE